MGGDYQWDGIMVLEGFKMLEENLKNKYLFLKIIIVYLQSNQITRSET